MWDKEPQLSGSHLGIILSLPSIKTPRSFSCKCLLSQLPASCLPVSPELRADEIFLNPDSFFEHMNTHVQLCVNSRCGQLPFVSSLKVLMRLSNRIRPGQKLGHAGVTLKAEMSPGINISACSDSTLCASP
uniref:Uncharacterized protein n=1 Tax=Myotis myotis TaxID=51298 RepID=A0A7J7TJC3_MYOMY|nr:hypothetical protein mMyoMyo1_009102 [Myotis myotis]